MKRLIPLGLVVLAACKASPPPAPQEAPRNAAVKVQTASVKMEDAPTWLLLTGQLKGAHETDLAANVAGRIVSTKVERGSKVKAGDPIALVDVRAAALTAAEAQAQADNAKSQAAAMKLDCERAGKLGASGAISKAEQDRLDAQCRSTDIMVSAANARSQLAVQYVGDGVIRAPFTGSISERYVDIGTYVNRDSKVVTMVDLDELRLEITVPETSIAAVKPGAKCRFTVGGYRDRTFEGTIRYVAASVRQATRDIVAEAVVSDPDGVLRSGMFASVRLEQGMAKLPALPKDSLVTREGRASAFVVAAGRVEQRYVQAGDDLGDGFVSVARGVADGERVVMRPGNDLTNGQAVE